jgi:hypothetical protein
MKQSDDPTHSLQLQLIGNTNNHDTIQRFKVWSKLILSRLEISKTRTLIMLKLLLFASCATRPCFGLEKLDPPKVKSFRWLAIQNKIVEFLPYAK